MGEVLASLSKKTPLPSSVVILEILVTRRAFSQPNEKKKVTMRAIQFAHEIGIHHSIFIFKVTMRLICLALLLIT